MQIGLLESQDFSEEVLESLKKIGDVSLFDSKDLDAFILDKEVLFIRLNYYISLEFLTKAKQLKYICTPTTGLNHIDLIECQKRNIKVVSLKDEYHFLKTIRATPEHTIGLIIGLLRNYAQAINVGSIKECNRELYKGEELYQNNVGIIGFGRVGKILSSYLEVFGAKVLFYDIDEKIEGDGHAVKVNSIRELIDHSKIIVLSASYSIEFDGFIDKLLLGMMRNRYFINIARGELVDESHLLEKIKEGFFKGVALDVVRNETNPLEYDKWINVDSSINFIHTPHIAGATYESMQKTEQFIFQKLLLDVKNN